MQKNIFLSQLYEKVKNVLSDNFTQSYWIIAEISDLTVNYRGHCYLELIEKKKTKVIAKAKATIWSYRFGLIKSYFETTTKQKFTSNIKVLLKVHVSFHEIYGFSLNVEDIEPTYTLGEIEKERIEILNQLKNDGILEMNKNLNFPVVPQKIAIISSVTAAGYEDFINQLQNNSYNYHFDTQLFPAVMQGNEAENSIIKALQEIFKVQNNFDLLILIRGGGSKNDLSCFNNYNLSYYIAQFPLPILTGIGHERDKSIADEVAFLSLKTPTAVAEFLISQVYEFDNFITKKTEQIFSIVLEKISEQKNKLNKLTYRFSYFSKDIFHHKQTELNNFDLKLKLLKDKYLDKKKQEFYYLEKIFYEKIAFFLKNENNKLKNIETKINLLKPAHILKRGYAIIRKNNKIIKKSEQLSKNDIINIEMKNEIIEVQVLNKKCQN